MSLVSVLRAPESCCRYAQQAGPGAGLGERSTGASNAQLRRSAQADNVAREEAFLNLRSANSRDAAIHYASTDDAR